MRGTRRAAWRRIEHGEKLPDKRHATASPRRMRHEPRARSRGPLVGRYPGWRSDPCDLPGRLRASSGMCARDWSRSDEPAPSAVPLRGQRGLGRRVRRLRFRFPFNCEGMNAFTGTNASHSKQPRDAPPTIPATFRQASPMSKIEELAERVERLLLRHRSCSAPTPCSSSSSPRVTDERDNLRSRLERGAQPHRRAARAAAARPGRAPTAAATRRERADVKQIEVTILGQSYILGCPDGGERAARSGGQRRPRDERDPRCRQGQGARAHRRAGGAEPGLSRWPSARRRRRTRRRRRHAAADVDDVDVDGLDPPHRHSPRRRRTTALIDARCASRCVE